MKGSTSEILLMIGLLIATSILLVQLKTLISLHQKQAESLAVETFAKDLETLIHKSFSITGDVAFSYKPGLKKYVIDVDKDGILIKDKASDKTVYLKDIKIDLEPTTIEDEESICIVKLSAEVAEEKRKDLRFGIAGHWWWLRDYKDKFIEFYKDLGVTNVRLGIGWTMFDHGSGSYDWSVIDEVLTPLKENDIEIIALYVGFPPYIAENKEKCAEKQLKCKVSRDKEQQFREAAKATVERYSYIKYWEFWNEPEMYEMMKDPNEYKFWLNAFYETVKSVDPNKQVAACTLTGWNFIGQIYDEAKMDAIAYHPYSREFINVNEIERIRNELVKRGHHEKTIWLTEYGWQTSEIGEDGQAENLRKTLEWIKQKDYIKIANLHMLHDWEDNERRETYGLLTIYPNFEKKKSYFVFKEMAKGGKEYKYLERDSLKIIPGSCPKLSLTRVKLVSEKVFSWPVDSYTLTSCFGWRYDVGVPRDWEFHTGIDLAVPEGTEVKAAHDGEVIKVLNDDGSGKPSGYGNYVILKHNIEGKNYYSFYGHLKCNGVTVKEGDKVKKGDIIGYSGGKDECKGTSTGAHLHFEIREDSNSVKNSINPCLLLKNCDCKTDCERYSQKDDDSKCPKS